MIDSYCKYRIGIRYHTLRYALVFYLLVYLKICRIEGGELFERVIDDDFVLTEKSVAVFMKQICEGVAFIHSKNVLHLDMKVSYVRVRVRVQVPRPRVT